MGLECISKNYVVLLAAELNNVLIGTSIISRKEKRKRKQKETLLMKRTKSTILIFFFFWPVRPRQKYNEHRSE